MTTETKKCTACNGSGVTRAAYRDTAGQRKTAVTGICPTCQGHGTQKKASEHAALLAKRKKF